MTHDEIEFFDRLASTYDCNEKLSTPLRIGSILSKLPLRKGMDVLDLGTGTGVLVPYLHETVGPGGTVTAVDMSDGMLSVARKKFGTLGNVKFLRLDFEESPLPGCYDIVFLYSVYPHLHRPEETLKRLLLDNLKPEGCMVVAFPTDESYINNIHRRRKAESDLLPPAGELASRMRGWGLDASVVAATHEEYIIVITGASIPD